MHYNYIKGYVHLIITANMFCVKLHQPSHLLRFCGKSVLHGWVNLYKRGYIWTKSSAALKASRCKSVTWQTWRNFVWVCLWFAEKHIGSPLGASWSKEKGNLREV